MKKIGIIGGLSWVSTVDKLTREEIIALQDTCDPLPGPF